MLFIINAYISNEFNQNLRNKDAFDNIHLKNKHKLKFWFTQFILLLSLLLLLLKFLITCNSLNKCMSLKILRKKYIFI
jgi:hypothetical protein